MTPEDVIKELSDAQKRALCGIPVKRDFTPKHTGFPWTTLSCLKRHRLINGVKADLGGMGPDVLHRITPLGLAVREILKAQP